MRSLGLDVSTSATGMVLLENDIEKMKPSLLHEETISFPKIEKGASRSRAIVTRIMEYIHAVKPDRIVIEGYSLNMKNPSSVVPLVELGGLLRFMLHVDGLTWLDPRASELKKFVIGKGVGLKSHMMMSVLDRWGHKSANDNTADAYGLACIGLCYANMLSGATLEQRKIVGSLKMRSG